MSDLDDLLADLENDSGNEVDSPENNDIDEEKEARIIQSATDDNSNIHAAVASANEASDIARLLYSKEMQDTLREIAEYKSKAQRTMLDKIEADPEYQLIVRANDISIAIDEEIRRVHEFIKQRYATCFPELDNLVKHPLQYANTVKVIGKQKVHANINVMNAKLSEIVSRGDAQSIVVTATTSDGRDLTDDEIGVVDRACDMIVELDAAKVTILKYIQARIEMIAPNVSKIVGALTAAKIVSQAGGIGGLAYSTASNIPSLGKKQGNMNGLSRLGSRAQGFLYYCDLVQSVPEDIRAKALRQISGKLMLAARMDMTRASPAGETGQLFRDELVKKLDKLSEPPELKDVKALPAPDDPNKSRRGGKKVRKAKEKYAITKLQQLRNRQKFGEQEAEVGYGDETEGMGMIGEASSIRAPTIDKRTQAKLGKQKRKGGQLIGPASLMSNRPDQPRLDSRLPGIGVSGSATSGTQSSLSFSSVQGIELPCLRIGNTEKKDASKWFQGGTYSQIKKP